MLAHGEYAQAMSTLDALAARTPEPEGVEHERGLAFYQQAKLPEAAQAFAKAMSQDPADHESIAMEGVVLFRLGRSKDAIPLLESAKLSLASQNVDNNYVLGLCYLDAHRFDDARHAFATQYHFAPDSPSAYLLAARMMLRRDFLPVADATARTALQLDPHLPMAHFLLGQVALAKQQLPQALEEFQAERTLNPLQGEVYDRLGDTYLRMGDLEKAQDALDEAVLLEPASPVAYILLGHVLQKKKNYPLAQQYLDRALVLSPNMYRAHFYLGQVLQSLGRQADAEREFHLSEQLQAADRDVPSEVK